MSVGQRLKQWYIFYITHFFVFDLVQKIIFTFPADHLLGLRLACDRHHLHQQSVTSLPDQRHHLLVSQFNYIHPIYLRQGGSKRGDRVRRLDAFVSADGDSYGTLSRPSQMSVCGERTDGAYLDEEVSCPQTSSPGHPLHIHRLQILEGRKCWGGGELFNGSLS